MRQNKQQLSVSRLILIIIGINMIGKGIFYINHGTYFVWPPNMVNLENNDVVGWSFIVTGVLLSVHAFLKHYIPKSIRALIYGMAAFLMTTISILEWCHFLLLNIPMSAMSNTTILCILLVLAWKGDFRA